jgi:magnesium transporter
MANRPRVRAGRKFRTKRRPPPGSAPGTLVGEPGLPPTTIRVIAYGSEGLEEHAVPRVEELQAILGRQPVTWIDIDGLGDAETVRKIGEIFHLHPLAQEDILNTYQRAKVEPYGEHLFVVLRMFSMIAGALQAEQFSLFFGPGVLISFQQVPGDCLDPVRERLRRGGSIRDRGADFLAYALLDTIIDAYFPVIEDCGTRLEEVELEVLSRPGPHVVRRIHEIRSDLLVLRRAVWPLRDAVNALVRDPHPVIRDETRVFLRDCYDHTVQIMDLVETFRELAAGLTDIYLSSLGQKTNETMRLLTVISTVFIPLTFLAGLWGMNFDPGSSPLNMPELRWRWGYPLALLIMFGLGLVMLVMFRKRGWLGAPKENEDPGAEGSSRPPGGVPPDR